MIKFIEDKPITDSIVDSIKPEDLEFLDLTGRRAYYSQGFYGQGEVVGVIDSGVSPHPEYEDRLLEGRNFTKDHNGDPDITTDHFGHGTHCAGSIAGKNVGVAPKCEIVPIKVLGGGDGEGEWAWIIEGLKYAKDWRHPKTGQKLTAVSMSLSADDKGIREHELLQLKIAISDLVKNGTAVFCSMGNTSGDSIRYPACLDEVIAVGAVDIKKEQAYFTTTGDHADICQVGVHVLSACNYGGYVYMSGTSMSTPISCGGAILIANKYRETFKKPISEDLLWNLVKFNTKDLGIPGVDKVFGAGFFTLQPLELNMWMQHDNKNIVINGEVIEMESPAKIENGRFLIPIRYASDVGAYVMWNPEDQSAKVVY